MSESNLNPFQAPMAELNGPPTIDPGLGAAVAAERGARFAAIMLDGLCLLPATVVVFAIAFMAGTAKRDGGPIPAVVPVLGALAGLYALVFVCYQMYSLTKRGQTLGKRWMKIRIVKVDGSAPGFVHAVLLRAILGGVIGAIPYLGGLYGLVDALFIFRDDRRCVHDHIAGTRVVKA
jgi:uncharacterized RDD family membrane protein YckC